MRALIRVQHTERGQAGGGPEQAGEPRHRDLRAGVAATAAAQDAPRVPLSPAAPALRLRFPAGARGGHVQEAPGGGGGDGRYQVEYSERGERDIEKKPREAVPQRDYTTSIPKTLGRDRKLFYLP